MKKIFMIGVLAAVLLVSIAFAGSPGPIEPKDTIAKPIDVEKSFTKLDPNAEVRVIVTLKDKATDAKIEDMKVKVGPFKVESKGWDMVYPKGFAATMTKGQMLQLLRDPAVARVDIDQKVYVMLETANYWSGATKARAAPPTGYNVTGDRDGIPHNYSTTDVVIAIVDTGIDPMHKDLSGIDNGGTVKIIGWYDRVNGITTPYDDHGHGTHVASIAAGEGDDDPRLKGVAPGAALVGVKVLTSGGWGYWSWVIDGVNWVVTYKDYYGIKIMSLSLGGMGSSDGKDPCSAALNNAVNQGIVVTVAAGNAGPQKHTINSPAAAANVITVGAIADVGYLLSALSSAAVKDLAPPISPEKKVTPAGWMPLEDNGFYLAPWSSRGPTADMRTKPDVVAPGVSIMAAQYIYPNTADFHGGYLEMSGTSMAAPFVAGVAALMLDANYTLAPTQVKNYIRGSAEEYGVTGCDIDYGCGRIRAFRAIGLAANLTKTDQWVPTHLRYWTSINDTTLFRIYPVNITNANYPFASTLIMYDWSGYTPGINLDLSATDPLGNYIGGSYGGDRQETLTIAPDYIGRYNLTVEKAWWWVYYYGWTGSGRYTLDISKR